MRLLLDTHSLYWFLIEPGRLARPALAAIESPENQVFYSAASIWEMLIKAGKGKLPVPDDFEAEMVRHGLEPLPVLVAHAWQTASLPPIHRDPFDRILVAQAQVERLTVVTRDEVVKRYDVAVLPA